MSARRSLTRGIGELLRLLDPGLSDLVRTPQNQINGEVRRPPKKVISVIKKGIELRNKLVHGREETVTTEDVREMLEAVRDLLYMLDYYRGHGWAMERLSPEVAANLQEQ